MLHSKPAKVSEVTEPKVCGRAHDDLVARFIDFGTVDSDKATPTDRETCVTADYNVQANFHTVTHFSHESMEKL